MKYTFTLFALLLFTAAQAQVSVGLLAGYNRSQEKYDVETPDGARLHIPSYHVSGLMTVPVGQRFELLSEFGFIQRGAACMPGFVGFEQDSELRVRYAQLNVNAAYDLVRWRRFRISVYAGLGASRLLSGNTTTEDLWNNVDMRRELDLDDSDRWNRTDAGANLGTMIRLRAGCGDLIARVGAYRGFRDVDSENGSLSRDLLLSLGYTQSL